MKLSNKSLQILLDNLEEECPDESTLLGRVWDKLITVDEEDNSEEIIIDLPETEQTALNSFLSNRIKTRTLNISSVK